MEKSSNTVRMRSFAVLKLLLLGVSFVPKAAVALESSKSTIAIEPGWVKASNVNPSHRSVVDRKTAKPFKTRSPQPLSPSSSLDSSSIEIIPDSPLRDTLPKQLDGETPAEDTPSETDPSIPSQPLEVSPDSEPNTGSNTEESPADGSPPPTQPTEASPPAEVESGEETPASPSFVVQKIEVVGSSILTAEDLEPLTAPLEGTEVTIEDLRTVADRITQMYLDRDFITSRAILLDQEIVDGVVEIRVIEGSLSDIEVEGTEHLNESYITSRIELGAKTPLNTAQLEDQLRLLRANSLFESVEASLRAGDDVGESILIVRVTEALRFGGFLGIDNYSPPSVGSERISSNVRFRNITGIGDEFSAGYNRTTAGGTDVFDFAYRIPLNAMEGTLTLRAAPNRNRAIQEPFKTLGIRGERELYEINFRQPLVRSPREEFALSWGFTFQDGQTFTLAGPTPFGDGPDDRGVTRTSVFQFGQDYVRRDLQGAWALRSLFRVGTSLFDATQNESTIADGQFVSWLGQAQRVQRLGDNHLLITQLDVQLTPDPLLPSQQFVIGGGLSLRGYRQNVRSGDNGFRFSVEDRITLARDAAGLPVFQLIPFIDAGGVWNVFNKPDNPQLEQRFLVGAGLGLSWEPEPGFRIRLDYGIPLIDLDDRGENAQDDGFHFSVGYGF
ncbi:MAG: ShlB/FhaC/HecB family hemolysin secretion/activation protein [Cyanobacteriota bacterium]|nr:ShlB/FhaC/HecB family hemolysin secretion/activation protein [Cyanobacteriota bacterium]